MTAAIDDKFNDVEFNFDDVEFLATNSVPFGKVFRALAKAGYKLGIGASQDSVVIAYEDALRKHKAVLLERGDTRQDVRRYIERYIRN